MNTCQRQSKPHNGYGLYDIAGKVAEWSNSSFDNNTYNTAYTLNSRCTQK
ncbi:MAG: SUMF1/EgtB/PvdO family nonheme iron enzyme [Flavobacteriales bacterium AspAUS03]